MKNIIVQPSEVYYITCNHGHMLCHCHKEFLCDTTCDKYHTYIFLFCIFLSKKYICMVLVTCSVTKKFFVTVTLHVTMVACNVIYF